MGRIFVKQSALRITLKVFCSLEGILSAVIKYKKPDGIIGEFAAFVVDMARGVISHEVLEGELDAAGWWVFWAYVTFSDGRTAAGEAAKVYIWHEGAG